jgi:hypothetical protein
MNNKRRKLDERDEFDILASIWVIASNDTNPIVFYETVYFRLSLSEKYNLKALIEKRGDLFRNHASQHRLEALKNRWLNEASDRPAWLLDGRTEAEQILKIHSLQTNDAFQSQFRGFEGDQSRSSLEVVDWGLQHIERLRKTFLESREDKIKRWQLWSVMILTTLDLIVTIIVALIK